MHNYILLLPWHTHNYVLKGRSTFPPFKHPMKTTIMVKGLRYLIHDIWTWLYATQVFETVSCFITPNFWSNILVTFTVILYHATFCSVNHWKALPYLNILNKNHYPILSPCHVKACSHAMELWSCMLHAIMGGGVWSGDLQGVRKNIFPWLSLGPWWPVELLKPLPATTYPSRAEQKMRDKIWYAQLLPDSPLLSLTHSPKCPVTPPPCPLLITATNIPLVVAECSNDTCTRLPTICAVSPATRFFTASAAPDGLLLVGLKFSN